MTEILTQEQIDEMIKNEHKRLSWKTVKNKPQKQNNWDEDILFMRRQAILKMLGAGMTKHAVVLELIPRWGICKSSAYNYIKDAFQFIADNYKEDVDSLKDVIMHRLEALAEDAIQASDRKNALRAYDQISKLAGLYTEKVEVQQDTNITFNFGDN